MFPEPEAVVDVSSPDHALLFFIEFVIFAEDSYQRVRDVHARVELCLADPLSTEPATNTLRFSIDVFQPPCGINLVCNSGELAFRQHFEMVLER